MKIFQFFNKFKKRNFLSNNTSAAQPNCDCPSGSLARLRLNDDDKSKFFLRLCYDLLVEILHSGNRCKLAKLERIGQRIHLIVEKNFNVVPFLRLNLSFLVHQELKAFIGCGYPDKCILPAEFAAIPPFLRFKDNELHYRTTLTTITSGATIQEKCELIKHHLRTLKPGLDPSSSIVFHASILKQDCTHFNRDSQLLGHIQDELLPIFGSCRRFEFNIWVENVPVPSSSRNIIESLLKMPQIDQCANVVIRFYHSIDQFLPVDAIAQWLNLKMDRIGKSNRRNEAKFLSIYLPDIQNILEIYWHLAEAFKKANVPTTPFTFLLVFRAELDGPEDQTKTNKTTNEEFSVHTKKDGRLKVLGFKRSSKTDSFN